MKQLAYKLLGRKEFVCGDCGEHIDDVDDRVFMPTHGTKCHACGRVWEQGFLDPVMGPEPSGWFSLNPIDIMRAAISEES